MVFSVTRFLKWTTVTRAANKKEAYYYRYILVLPSFVQFLDPSKGHCTKVYGCVKFPTHLPFSYLIISPLKVSLGFIIIHLLNTVMGCILLLWMSETSLSALIWTSKRKEMRQLKYLVLLVQQRQEAYNNCSQWIELIQLERDKQFLV